MDWPEDRTQRIAFPIQPSRQTSAPATAPSMKWSAVQTIATKITNGYVNPISMQSMRDIDGSRRRCASVWSLWLKNDSGHGVPSPTVRFLAIEMGKTDASRASEWFP